MFLAKDKAAISRFFGTVVLTTQPVFYLFQLNNRNTKNTKARCEMCLQVTVRIPERPQ